jgi:hypothetical protein
LILWLIVGSSVHFVARGRKNPRSKLYSRDDEYNRGTTLFTGKTRSLCRFHQTLGFDNGAFRDPLLAKRSGIRLGSENNGTFGIGFQHMPTLCNTMTPGYTPSLLFILWFSLFDLEPLVKYFFEMPLFEKV